MKRVSVRKLPAIVVAAGLLVSLSACSSGPAAFGGCTPGDNAKLVTATGAIEADPAAEFPTPLVAKSAELSIVERGDGATIQSGDGVITSTSLYNGETGEALNSQQGPLTGVTLRSFVNNGIFPFTSAFSCATVGSRVAMVGPASDLFGPDALGLDPDTTIVVVSDITSAFPGQATGADQLPQAGFPSVVFTPRGQPGFTFPSSTAIPTSLTIAALKQGSGETVAEGDTLSVNITGVVWGGKETFASSWTNNQPAPLVASPLNDAGEGVAPGLAKALIGQQVGSRLIVVIPPGDDSYPEAQLPTGVAATDTLVFVVDILAIS